MSSDRSTAAPRLPRTDPALTIKRFETPETVLVFAQGRLELFSLGGMMLAKGSYAPGWRWSQAVSPPRRTGFGPGKHSGIVLSGRVRIRMPRGVEADLTPGDFFHVETDYESWVVGYRPCEILYVEGIAGLLERLRGQQPDD